MTHNSRILIVDDDRDLRKVIRTALASDLREIREAATALDGLRCANEMPPDILLLDIGLPGHFNGFALCESLRKDPRHHKLRVVVISGHDELEDLEQAKRLSVVAYLVKPFSPITLTKLIRQFEDQTQEMLTIASDPVSNNTLYGAEP